MVKGKFNLKSLAEISILRAGGRRLAEILAKLAVAVRSGITTRSLDALARGLIGQAGGEPAFLNYRPAGASTPFPAALCVSINDEVVHGIPDDQILIESDLVGLDLGLKYQGLFTDAAITIGVGEISSAARDLIEITHQALLAGITAASSRATIGDIGHAIAAAIPDRQKYGLVTDFGGHGVGHHIHEPPEISNVGECGAGERLLPGLVIAIEPMVAIGSGQVKVAADGWTVKTKEGGLAAHFEHTVLITEAGTEILTKV